MTVVLIAFGALVVGWLAYEFFVGFPRAVRTAIEIERACWNRMADDALAAGDYAAANACREIARRGPYWCR